MFPYFRSTYVLLFDLRLFCFPHSFTMRLLCIMHYTYMYWTPLVVVVFVAIIGVNPGGLRIRYP